jgi:flagellar hook-length control protein FliK
VLTPHGQQLVIDKAEQFGQLGHDRNDRQQGNPETKLFQGTVVDLQAMNGRTAEHYAAVVQGQTTSVPTAPTPSQFVPPALPAHHVTDVAQQPIASMLRSVVVDVAQPDLGHVNIRVAMMNDFVHAHFSTDRAEVGQYLMNGQDRLQTTLQASGLDMGQFRVDIDRQNGGRSFQQGLFQEQGQTWNQGSHGLEKEQVQGRPDDMRLSPQGRLNVVA